MKILINLFFLTVFFPFIKFIPRLDTQPIALLLGSLITIIFIIKDKKMEKNLFLLFSISLIFIVLIDFNEIFTSLRGLLNYVSLPVIAYSTYRGLGKIKDNNKIVKISINIWFLIGFIQKYFSRFFLKDLISDMRTSEMRGVTSLSPEPTFYGIICIFFMIIVIENFDVKSIKNYIVNLLIQIILFSQSSMTVLFLMIFLILWLGSKLTIQKFVYSIIAFILGDFIILNFMKGTRGESLYKKSSDIKTLFHSDYSLNQRLSHIYYSIKGGLENYLFPNGFFEWANYTLIESKNKNYFYSFVYWPSGRIMSGIGAVVFETGFLGIIFLLIFYKVLKKGFKNKYLLVLYILISFSAIQLSLPFNGYLLGMCLYKIHKNKKRNFAN